MSFELEVTSWVFESGHRIRLDLAGTDWPNAWAPPEPVTLSIERASSAIVLPVVDGPPPLAKTPNLPASRRPQKWDADGATWSVEHDLPRRETRARFGYGSAGDADDVAPKMRDRVDGEVGVAIDDPGRAWVDATSSYLLVWPEVAVSAEARARVHADADAYHLLLEIRATEDGTVRWSRRFERRFARRLQ